MLSPKQKEFLKTKLHRINLLYGSVRSGKTWISLLKWALWVGQQPEHQSFLMVGKTLTTLKRNCLELLCEMVGDDNFQYSISQKKATLFGRTVWLEGANDTSSENKIRGMTLKGAYIDELTLIPQTFYLMVLSRLSERGALLLATTNPDHPEHYVKTDIIDNNEIDTLILKFLIDDNIFLDEEYKENLKKEYTGVYHERFILGEFVRAEGVIFKNFANNHTPWLISAKDVKKEFRWIEVGFDLGGNGSAYALTATAEGYDGKYYVLKAEKTQADLLNMEDIEKLVVSFCAEVEKQYGKDIDFLNCDHIAAIINSINDHTPYRADLTYKPPLEDRPFVISKLLANNQLLFVDGKCDDLIHELKNLVYDEKSNRPIPLDDGSMQIDTWDSFMYSLSGHWGRIYTEE